MCTAQSRWEDPPPYLPVGGLMDVVTENQKVPDTV